MIINQNDLYDRLQEYIDKKIDVLEQKLRDLFIEYQLKDIADNLRAIQIVARLEDYIRVLEGLSREIYSLGQITTEIKILAGIEDAITQLAPAADAILVIEQNISELKAIGDNIEEILKADDMALYSKQYSQMSKAHELTSNSYAVEAYQEHVNRYYYSTSLDQIIEVKTNDYSAYHWSEVARMYSYGLKFQGGWDSVACSLPPVPTPPAGSTADGYAYIIESVRGDITNCPDMYPGDWLIWTGDDPAQPGVQGHWVVVHRQLEWSLLLNVPDNVLNALNSRGDIMTGDLDIGYDNKFYMSKGDFNNRRMEMGLNQNDSFYVALLDTNGNPVKVLTLSEAGDLFLDTNRVWHSGNDGIGSGLDADMLGGESYTRFPMSDAIDNIVVMTQDQYDAITPDPKTLYLIECE